VDFGILGDEEVCCGSVLLRVGLRELAGELVRHNIEQINALGVETVVTSCAGCYKTFSQDYPAFGALNARVLHSSQFFMELIQQGRLRPSMSTKLKVTYHDPCHLGRHGRVFDAPRDLIAALDRIQLREMPRNRENAWCCGAGGGVRSAFPEWARETSRIRVQEAIQTGADTVVTACPFCLQNLSAGLQAEGSRLRLMDLTDLVVSALKLG
jgi:heterodisulfide reductase subunit D